MRRRLPLLITALLTVMVITFSWAAYRSLRGALVAAAGVRVVQVATRLAASFAESAEQLRREGTPLSRDPALRRALGSGDGPSRAAAQAVLVSERARNAQLVRVGLFSRRGERLASAGDDTETLTSLDDASTRVVTESPILPLVLVRDTILSRMRVPVLSATGDTLGFLRQHSRMSSRQSAQLVRSLIGGDAVFLVGNATGDLWTDFTARVEGPREQRPTGAPVVTTDRDGVRWIGALTTVPGVPWLVWVAQPQAAVVGPALAFLLKMAGIALVVIAIGAFASRALTSHIVAPLEEVTHAAERIAAGDYSRRVTAHGSDEVGRLSAAFNTMVSAVQESQVNLENQQAELEAQQAELEEQQTELEEANEDLQSSVVSANRARDEAERSRVRAAAVVSEALDCIITMDHTGAIVDFNPAAVQTFGHAAADVIGQPLEILMPASFRDRHRMGLARYLATGESRILGQRIQVAALRSDGTEIPVELTIVKVPIDGPPQFTAFLRDLSQRKELEERLQQSQRMDAVGQLAGGVAHDFNNILTVIVSYGDMLLAEPDLATTVRADVEQIRAAADRATALTRQLLAFSRKQVLQPVVLDPNAVVGEMQAMLARLIREDIQLQTNLSGNIWSIRVDKGQFEQVLVNLVVNARDAMPEGGTLVIETGNVELDGAYVATHAGAVTGPHVMLTVRDTGSGMDTATRHRIFDPFFTTKGPGKGTGLGLSTVYGIVKQSGGSIYVYSEPGLGTTFRIYFPRHAGTPVSPMAAVQRPTPATRLLRVLLVEDDPSVRQATRVVLEHLKYVVAEAPDVATALGLIRLAGSQFDFVLTDAVMPGQSGLELAEILREERPALRVVLMSGYAAEVVHRGRELPDNVTFLEKPFTTLSLSKVLAGLL